MISPSKLEDTNFSQVFGVLEAAYVSEIENMLVANLIENKTVEIPGTDKDSLEFLAKTNFKLRLKRPHKNVWSVSLQSLKDSIRKVLREGKLEPVSEKSTSNSVKTRGFELPVFLLLHTVPNEEFLNRSFVGNKVTHPQLGEGEVIRISDSGNVEIQFPEKTILLKPGFIQLKVT